MLVTDQAQIKVLRILYGTEKTLDFVELMF